jgi:hypothetical protein
MRFPGVITITTIALGAALGQSACTDPVRDAEIQALGPETNGAPGPDHRPGQPCLHCHSSGGPASNKPFAIAGTIYKNDTTEDGAEGIFVQFVDARGRGPLQVPQSGPTGNFYVPLQDWPNLAFPVRVALYEELEKAPIAVMKSLIGREGSCNYCHKPIRVDGKPNEEETNAMKSSAGQYYLTAGGGAAATDE